ncbi:MAG: hypothetical protein WBC74_01160 [Candidatus Omnitrophota bacterium]
MKTLFTSILLIIFLFNVNSFAQIAGQVKMEDKYNYLTALSYVDTLTQPVKRYLRENKIGLEFFAGVLQGFDNNVNLDPSRKKDGFLETSLNTEVTYNYTDEIRLKLENYTTDILYYNVNNANMLDVYTKVGLEADVLKKVLTLGTDYAFDFVYFPVDEDGTYLGNEARVYAKHNILPYLYQRLRYKYLHKNYTSGKTRAADSKKTDTLRRDNRHIMDYELGFYLSDKAILKTNLELYRNTSNYEYFSYYDFWSFRVRPSYILTITKKLYTSGSFIYQQRRYDDRRSSENDEHVYDDTYSFNASLLYNLTRSFTIALNCSYRENISNEPLQKYSGTIFTGGVYYSF